MNQSQKFQEGYFGVRGLDDVMAALARWAWASVSIVLSLIVMMNDVG